MRTRFTELVGCDVPIQLAAMGGGVGTPQLATAVAAAGGLGMIGAAAMSREELIEAFSQPGGQPARDRAVGAGFLLPFLDRDVVAAVAPLARVIEFFYGDPDASLVGLGKAGGALVSWQVGSVDEARMAADAGCDFVIAQGIESGGHVRGRIGLLTLLDGVLGAVDVPVLAAGGVATARGMAAALAAGADGVRIGTRFLLAQEASTHPDYQEALLAATAADTVVTETFNLLWPDAPHRVLRSCLQAAAERSAAVPDKPPSGAISATGQEMPLFGPAPPTDTVRGSIAALALYAGESVSAARSIAPAAEIIREICDGAEAVLRQSRERLAF